MATAVISKKSVMEESPLVHSSKRPSYLEITLNQPASSRFDDRICRSLQPQFIDLAKDTAEPIRTYLRLRPYSKKTPDEIEVVEIKDEETVIANSLVPGKTYKPPKKTEYKFTKVLDSTCTQQQVFDSAVAPLMECFERGENCLIFSYGATNSGKTFTMQGKIKHYGIIPRTLDHIFTRYQGKLYKGADIQPFQHESTRALNLDEKQVLFEKKAALLNAAAKTNEWKNRPSSAHANMTQTSETSSHCGSIKYLAGTPLSEEDYSSYEGSSLFCTWVSFVELYNEKCFDLLDNSEKGKGKRRVLKLVTGVDKTQAYLQDVTELPVFNEEEAYAVYVAGYKKLQVASTNANQTSSRSHCFFTLRVLELGVTKSGVFPIQNHKITFCDLAGMERQSQTENFGGQLRESANINQSLSSLLKVIRMIREKQLSLLSNIPRQTLSDRIPFRDSKLTRLFQGYFTNATHIAMIVNVNPNPAMAISSIQTLQNSAIASNIIAYRPSYAPTIVVENHRKSFLHSSRDMEDIVEQTEDEDCEFETARLVKLEKTQGKTDRKPQGRPKTDRKPQGRSCLSEQNHTAAKRDLRILTSDYSDDSDKENEIGDPSTVIQKRCQKDEAIIIEKLRAELYEKNREINSKNEEIKNLTLLVNTIEQQTREKMALEIQEGLAHSAEVVRGLKSEKRCQEYQSRLTSARSNCSSNSWSSTASIATQTYDVLEVVPTTSKKTRVNNSRV